VYIIIVIEVLYGVTYDVHGIVLCNDNCKCNGRCEV